MVGLVGLICLAACGVRCRAEVCLPACGWWCGGGRGVPWCGVVVVGRQVRSGRPSLLHSLGSYLSWFLIELSWIVPCRELDWIVVQGQVAPESDLTPSSQVGRLVGWSVGWLVGWLVVWLVGWLVVWFHDWLVGRLVVGWLSVCRLVGLVGGWVAGWLVGWEWRRSGLDGGWMVSWLVGRVG